MCGGYAGGLPEDIIMCWSTGACGHYQYTLNVLGPVTDAKVFMLVSLRLWTVIPRKTAFTVTPHFTVALTIRHGVTDVADVAA